MKGRELHRYHHAMLVRFTKRLRTRAAITFAILYTFCVLAPHAALAFADTGSALHCLNDQHGITSLRDHGSKTHRHADGVVHYHGDQGSSEQPPHSDGKSHPGHCCGLFCMSALTHEPGVTLSAPTLAALVQPAHAGGLPSLEPDRINRPPIA